MDHTTLGLDLAKSIFHYVIINANNRVIGQGKRRRSQLLDRLSNLKVDRTVMEACSSSHYWGRMFQELGHVVVLIPPHQVKPYVQGQKNDMNDALAIAEAPPRPGLKTVPAKTLAQQQVCALNNSRELKIKQRTQLPNSIRG